MYSHREIRSLLVENHQLAPASSVDYITNFVESGLDYYFDSDSVHTHPSEMSPQDLKEIVSDAHDYLTSSPSKPLESLMSNNVTPQAAGETWVAIRCSHGHEGTIYSDAMADDARLYGDIQIP